MRGRGRGANGVKASPATAKPKAKAKAKSSAKKKAAKPARNGGGAATSRRSKKGAKGKGKGGLSTFQWVVIVLLAVAALAAFGWRTGRLQPWIAYFHAQADKLEDTLKGAGWMGPVYVFALYLVTTIVRIDPFFRIAKLRQLSVTNDPIMTC